MENSTITNKQLQYDLATFLNQIKTGEAELQRTKVYLFGARTLLKSVKLDIDASKGLGGQLFKRTVDFLAE